MFDKLKQLQYGLKVKWYEMTQNHTRLLDLHGRKVQLLEGGAGEPLLYLHSAYGETLWLPFHHKLAATFHVIAPAHPGFAQTEDLDDIDSMEDMIFHYLDLLEQLGHAKINVVGVSLGGWIAAELATRYPERVKQLVLAAPAGLWLAEHPMTDLFALRRRSDQLRHVLFHNPESGLAELFVPTTPTDEQLAAGYKAMTATARLAWNPPGHNPKLAARLRRITSPTLILWGDDDKLIPPAYAAEWARHIKSARVQLLKDCGHMLMLECEGAFVQAVIDFLS